MELAPGYAEIDIDASYHDDVETVWTYFSDTQRQYLILPDGRSDLILTFCVDGAGRPRDVSPIFVAPFTKAKRIPLRPQQGFIGIRFKAGAAGGFLNAPLHTLAGSILYGDSAMRQLQCAATLFGEQPSIDHLVANLNRHVCAQSTRNVTRLVSDVLGLMYQSHGAIQVREIAALLGMTERTVNRSFTQVVGLAPKSFASIVRLHNALDLLSDEHASLAEVAVACGYADQAHMTRAFKSVIGHTPGVLQGSAFEGLLP